MTKGLQFACLTLASVALAGCSLGTRLGWTREQAKPTEIVRANCDAAVRTLQGKSDHDTAMDACVQTKTRQGTD